MKKADQLYRGRNAQFLMDNKRKQDSIDLENRNALVNIFEEIGYPNFNKLGEEPYEYPSKYNIKVILLHTPDSIREHYFLPKLLEYVRSGECNPIVYGALYDQLFLYNKMPQKYGTYIQKTPNLQSKDSINYFRKKIGLPNYGYEKWRSRTLYGDRF